MSETRPRRESNQAAMLGRIARRKQQKNPQRGIDTKHHPQGFFQLHRYERVNRTAKK
jgi:hypothetical protein